MSSFTNTFPEGIKKAKKGIRSQVVTVVHRSLEVIRSKIVPLTPRITGRLVGSIQGKAKVEGDSVYKVEEFPTKVEGVIGTNVPYAKFPEFGTSRMKGKFFFTTGFQQAEPEVRSVIQKGLNLNNVTFIN